MSKPNKNASNETSIFAGSQLRRVWYNNEWYYSIVDVIEVLTDSSHPRTYWNKLKNKVKAESLGGTLSQVVALKLTSPDGKLRQTDTANRQTLLRIIQSIPSPQAEPFKLWLAQVGDERIAEAENPELAVERMRATYRAKGYDAEWIEQRIKNDVTRNELTDEWKGRGARPGAEYAILTNQIHEGTFELNIQEHKQYKSLPTKSNLRDHMSGVELALTSLGEATSTMFHRERESQGFEQLSQDAQDAGGAAGAARRALEERVGHSVVSPKNYLPKPAHNPQLSMFEAETEAQASNKTKGKNKKITD